MNLLLYFGCSIFGLTALKVIFIVISIVAFLEGVFFLAVEELRFSGVLRIVTSLVPLVVFLCLGVPVSPLIITKLVISCIGIIFALLAVVGEPVVGGIVLLCNIPGLVMNIIGLVLFFKNLL